MTSTASRPPIYFGSYVGGQLVNPSADALTEDCTAILQRTVSAVVDTHKHTAKPDKPTTAAVSKAIEACEFKPITIADLAAALSNGCTVLPADCNGTRKLDKWTAQQLWFVDVDNDPAMIAKGFAPLGYTYAVERCNTLGLPLVMSYETFSSSPTVDPDPAKQRFRLVFALDHVEQDKAKAEAFGSALLAAFPESDPTTAQPNRLFFGTNKEVNVWFKNIFPL